MNPKKLNIDIMIDIEVNEKNRVSLNIPAALTASSGENKSNRFTLFPVELNPPRRIVS